MKLSVKYLSVIGLVIILSACAPQTSPSMMNNSEIELSRQTTIEQISVKDVTEERLNRIVEQYHKNSSGALDLTLTYNPKSSDFTAMNANHMLSRVKTGLQKKNVQNITAQILDVIDGTPLLIVSYDVVLAQAPSDCGIMPGLEDHITGRFIGEYKFGCGTQSLIAKQIARPTDLEGNADMDQRDARRESIVIEEYSAGVPRQPIEGVERDSLSSN